MNQPLYRSLRRLRGTFWRRRFLLWLIRAAWLTLLVPVVVMTGYFWQGWQVRGRDLLVSMVIIAGLVLLWSLRPIRLKQMVHRLDNRLGLRTRLVTAFEVDEGELAQKSDVGAADNLVIQRLFQETVQIAISIRQQVHLITRSVWLEIRTLIGVTALLSALIILNGLNPRIPTATTAALPPPWQEPTAEEVLSPDAQLAPQRQQPNPQQQQTLTEEQLQEILEALADPLRDQAASRAVADALDRGDVDEAAEELRRLTDRLDQISEEAQEDLGEALQEAADNIGEQAPGLSQPLQSGSDALEQDDLLEAGQSLEDVAEALESLGDPPPENNETETQEEESNGGPSEEQPEEGQAEPQDQGQTQEEGEADEESEGEESGAGDGAGDGDGPEQPTEEERLAAEGEPLELESDPELEDRVLQPAELDAEAGDEVTQDSPFSRQPNGNPGDLGPDPLSYPWEKREIIRSYFTP